MTSKVKKQEPKAPPVVYVEIDEDEAISVSELAVDAEDNRAPENRLARYKFDCFVIVEFEAVVTEVK